MKHPCTPKPTLKEKLLQMDIPGFLLISASVVCYLLAMHWGGIEKSWGSSKVVGTLVGSIVIFIAFVVLEWYQGDRALLLPSLLKKIERLLIAALSASCMYYCRAATACPS
jgi:hypothetical protein